MTNLQNDANDLLPKNVFAERDENLRLLGFQSYEDYLTSHIWDWIKSLLSKQEDSQRCFECGGVIGLAWHHRSYSIPVLIGNFSNVPYPDVVRVCRDCHRAIYSEGDKWFPLDIVDMRLRQLLRRYSHSATGDFVANERIGLVTTQGEYAQLNEQGYLKESFDDYGPYTGGGF